MSDDTPSNNVWSQPIAPGAAKLLADAYAEDMACKDAATEARVASMHAAAANNALADVLARVAKIVAERPWERHVKIYQRQILPARAGDVFRRLVAGGWTAELVNHRWLGPDCDCTMMYGCNHPDVPREELVIEISW